MLFHGFEKPDGWSDGQPEILVDEWTKDILGMPIVNYDGVHQMLTDDVGIPYDHKTKIKLHDTGRNPYGYFRPATGVIHVNAVANESYDVSSMGTIAFEGRQLFDHLDRSRDFGRSILWSGALTSLFITGTELSGKLHDIPQFAVNCAFIGVVLSRKRIVSPDPFSQERAEAQAIAQSTKEHETDLLFPHSPKTLSLAKEGRLTDELIQQLSLDAVLQPADSENTV
jgi:hypothetical protein